MNLNIKAKKDETHKINENKINAIERALYS